MLGLLFFFDGLRVSVSRICMVFFLPMLDLMLSGAVADAGAALASVNYFFRTHHASLIVRIVGRRRLMNWLSLSLVLTP